MLRRPSRVVIQPASPPGESDRTVALGAHTWRLSPPTAAAGSVWTWRRAAPFARIWALDSPAGTHLVLHRLEPFSRTWRADGAAESWSLVRNWSGAITVRDERDAILLRLHLGWLGPRRIEPAAGPDLALHRRLLRGYALESSEGRLLLTFERAGGFFRSHCRVTLAESALARADLLPLLALAWASALAHRAHAH